MPCHEMEKTQSRSHDKAPCIPDTFLPFDNIRGLSLFPDSTYLPLATGHGNVDETAGVF